MLKYVIESRVSSSKKSLIYARQGCSDEAYCCRAEGFSVKAHFLVAYRKAIGAILKSQMLPIRRRSGGLEAFEAFAADDDMYSLGLYLGTHALMKSVTYGRILTSPYLFWLLHVKGAPAFKGVHEPHEGSIYQAKLLDVRPGSRLDLICLNQAFYRMHHGLRSYRLSLSPLLWSTKDGGSWLYMTVGVRVLCMQELT